MEPLTGSILGVVEETMQPATISLWLREAAAPHLEKK
jgi:hypothetical protein